MTEPEQIKIVKTEMLNLADDLDRVNFKLTNVTTERDVANQEIERLTTEWRKDEQCRVDYINIIEGELTAAKEKIEQHIKGVARFLNDLYCIMIDPLVEGELMVAPMMLALLDRAKQDRELLSQLTAERDNVEKLRNTVVIMPCRCADVRDLGSPLLCVRCQALADTEGK